MPTSAIKLEETVTYERHVQRQFRNMHSNWKSTSCLVEAVQQDELEARAQHVETSEEVPYESCHRAGISGRRQGPAKNARMRSKEEDAEELERLTVRTWELYFMQEQLSSDVQDEVFISS